MPNGVTIRWGVNDLGTLRHAYRSSAEPRSLCGLAWAPAWPPIDRPALGLCPACRKLAEGIDGPHGQAAIAAGDMLAADAARLIGEAIGRQGLSYGAAARRLGITEAAVSQLVRGQSKPSLIRLGRIFTDLGVVARITLEEPSDGGRDGRSDGRSQHE